MSSHLQRAWEKGIGKNVLKLTMRRNSEMNRHEGKWEARMRSSTQARGRSYEKGRCVTWHTQIEGKVLWIAGSHRWVLVFIGQQGNLDKQPHMRLERKMLQLILFSFLLHCILHEFNVCFLSPQAQRNVCQSGLFPDPEVNLGSNQSFKNVAERNNWL